MGMKGESSDRSNTFYIQTVEEPGKMKLELYEVELETMVMVLVVVLGSTVPQGKSNRRKVEITHSKRSLSWGKVLQ